MLWNTCVYVWPYHRVLIRGYWRHLRSKQPSCRMRWTTSLRHRIHWRNTAAGCHRSKPVTMMNCWKFQVFCHDNMNLFSYLHCLNVCFKVVLIFCNIWLILTHTQQISHTPARTLLVFTFTDLYFSRINSRLAGFPTIHHLSYDRSSAAAAHNSNVN